MLKRTILAQNRRIERTFVVECAEIAVTGKRGKVVAGEECSVFQLCRFVVELTVFIRVAVFTVTFPVITLYSGIGAFSGIAAGARFSLSLFVQRLGAYIENTRHFLYRP